MAKAISLGPLSQIPTGEGRTFKIGDTRVAVFRTHKDMVYATQAECPHRMGPLADGMLGGTTLVCPLHDWMFDLTTGESLNGTCGIWRRAHRRRVDWCCRATSAVPGGFPNTGRVQHTRRTLQEEPDAGIDRKRPEQSRGDRAASWRQ
jgi:nitrite reductase (NADH) small subunit